MSMKMMSNWIGTVVAMFYITAVQPQPQPEEFQLRLNGNTVYEGYIEIYIDGNWGTVCDEGWSLLNSQVVCRELGFGLFVKNFEPFESDRGQPIFLDEVICGGQEVKLAHCKANYIGVHNCSHKEDVAIECAPANEYDVRLVDGVYTTVGRLEVNLIGEWYSVCNSQWSDVNDDIVCRQLGFLKATTFVENYKLKDAPPYIVPILKEYGCSGNEIRLEDCDIKQWFGDPGCNNDDDVKIQCTNEESAVFQGDVRLSGETEGVVEVYLYGDWRTMCTSTWASENNDVTCRQLGFVEENVDGSYYYDTNYDDAASKQQINIYKIACQGQESHLKDCNLSTDTYESKCMQEGIVQLSCKPHDTGLSAGAIAGIAIGIAIGTYMLYSCICTNKNAPTNAATATAAPSVNHNNAGLTDIALTLNTSAPPAEATDLPPTYETVITNPDNFQHPLETPPPDYMSPSSENQHSTPFSTQISA